MARAALAISPTRHVRSITIAANVNNINLFTLAGSPSDPGEFVFTINPGVTVSSSSTATAALSTGTFPGGSTVKLINSGNIYGKGGAGGPGGTSSGSGSPGGSGGDAISLGFDLIIDNSSGKIFGGGAGGAGGDGLSVAGGGKWASGDFGGGGGGGGQSGGAASGGSGGYGATSSGSTGGSGTPSGPGAGGAGGSGDVDDGNGKVTTYSASPGSPGAAWGSASGSTAGGRAIVRNSIYSVFWLAGNNGSQIKGAIV